MKGIIALRLTKREKACEELNAALSRCRQLLARGERNYGAQYIICVAQAGLAVAQNDSSYVDQAISSYNSGKAIADLKGFRARIQRLLDMVTMTDANNVLEELMRVAKNT